MIPRVSIFIFSRCSFFFVCTCLSTFVVCYCICSRSNRTNTAIASFNSAGAHSGVWQENLRRHCGFRAGVPGLLLALHVELLPSFHQRSPANWHCRRDIRCVFFLFIVRLVSRVFFTRAFRITLSHLACVCPSFHSLVALAFIFLGI